MTPSDQDLFHPTPPEERIRILIERHSFDELEAEEWIRATAAPVDDILRWKANWKLKEVHQLIRKTQDPGEATLWLDSLLPKPAIVAAISAGKSYDDVEFFAHKHDLDVDLLANCILANFMSDADMATRDDEGFAATVSILAGLRRGQG